MNIKKARTSFTIVRELNPSTAIFLRLFTLSALSCCFTFVSCQSNDVSPSTADKSTFAITTTGISLDISASSSQSVQVNSFSENGKSNSSIIFITNDFRSNCLFLGVFSSSISSISAVSAVCCSIFLS